MVALGFESVWNVMALPSEGRYSSNIKRFAIFWKPKTCIGIHIVYFGCWQTGPSVLQGPEPIDMRLVSLWHCDREVRTNIVGH